MGGGGGAGGTGGVGSIYSDQSRGGTGIASPLSASIPGFFGTPGPAPGRWFAGGGAGTSPPGGAGGGGNSGWAGNVNTGGGAGSAFSPSSTIVGYGGGSGIVVIRYPFVQTAEFTSVTANSTAVIEGGNVFFVVRTNFANTNTLFYDTIGNVTSASFVGGNTGSFVVTGNETVVRLETTTTVPLNEERSFALRIRQDAANGSIRLTSQNVSIYDPNVTLYMLATGGNVFTSGGFRTHIFTSSNNFVVAFAGTVGANIEYFTVAGGGGGGSSSPNGNAGGGGGGAGGVLSGTATLTERTYNIVVGSGGGFNTSGSNTTITAANFANVISVGGGNGGQGGGGNGGSGGGASILGSPGAPGTGGSGISGQGNPGSPSASGSPGGQAGSGGGAGGAGTRPAGGDGISSPLSPSIPGFFGTPGPAPGRWFAGGGGSGGYTPGGPAAGTGGAGGGGAGSIPVGTSTNGTINTGGGGGGNSTHPASGGSGIVIIRYPFA